MSISYDTNAPFASADSEPTSSRVMIVVIDDYVVEG